MRQPATVVEYVGVDLTFTRFPSTSARERHSSSASSSVLWLIASLAVAKLAAKRHIPGKVVVGDHCSGRVNVATALADRAALCLLVDRGELVLLALCRAQYSYACLQGVKKTLDVGYGRLQTHM